MSKSSRCRSIWDPVKRNECYQREEDIANKETDVYGLNKYTNNVDKNSPLAKMSFEELLEHAKNTRFGGKTNKRKIKSKSKKSKSKKSKYKSKKSKRKTMRRKTMYKRKK